MIVRKGLPRMFSRQVANSIFNLHHCRLLLLSRRTDAIFLSLDFEFCHRSLLICIIHIKRFGAVRRVARTLKILINQVKISNKSYGSRPRNQPNPSLRIHPILRLDLRLPLHPALPPRSLHMGTPSRPGRITLEIPTPALGTGT